MKKLFALIVAVMTLALGSSAALAMPGHTDYVKNSPAESGGWMKIMSMEKISVSSMGIVNEPLVKYRACELTENTPPSL